LYKKKEFPTAFPAVAKPRRKSKTLGAPSLQAPKSASASEDTKGKGQGRGRCPHLQPCEQDWRKLYCIEKIKIVD